MTPTTHQVTLMYLKDIVTFVADTKDITKEEARSPSGQYEGY